MTETQRCWSCGAQVLTTTARRNFGRCRPCAKKGWYGRLWEILTGTGAARRDSRNSPHVNELRRVFGLPPSATPTVDQFLEDLERSHIAASIDWRSEPAEAVAELRTLPLWSELPEGNLPDQAAELVARVAETQRLRGLRLVDFSPGTDGWTVVIVDPDQIPEISKWAKLAGLDEPQVL